MTQEPIPTTTVPIAPEPQLEETSEEGQPITIQVLPSDNSTLSELVPLLSVIALIVAAVIAYFA